MDTTLPSPTLSVRVLEAAEPCCGSVASPTLAAPQVARLADRLKALADPTRLGMLELLVANKEPLCVCNITDHFPQNQPTISHHLRILREAGLIAGEKHGVWAYYGATEAGKRSVALVKTLL
jgi:ArsR family transcriptional regulator